MVADGEMVGEGQPLYTLKIEKSVLDVNSPAGGVLKLEVAAGTTLKVGEIIGRIDALRLS